MPARDVTSQSGGEHSVSFRVEGADSLCHQRGYPVTSVVTLRKRLSMKPGPTLFPALACPGLARPAQGKQACERYCQLTMSDTTFPHDPAIGVWGQAEVKASRWSRWLRGTEVIWGARTSLSFAKVVARVATASRFPPGWPAPRTMRGPVPPPLLCPSLSLSLALPLPFPRLSPASFLRHGAVPSERPRRPLPYPTLRTRSRRPTARRDTSTGSSSRAGPELGRGRFEGDREGRGTEGSRQRASAAWFGRP